jgi:hypothetical protein
MRVRLGALLDKALGSDVMSGGDWDDLTALVSATPDLYIYPESAWTALAERLLAEMIISEGISWFERQEAVNRLLGHPVCELPMIAACASLAEDKTNQVFLEPLIILEISTHPDSTKHLLSQIRNPTNDRALFGAWSSVAEKAGRGYVTKPHLEWLTSHASVVLAEENVHDGIRLAAAELLHQGGFGRIGRRASAYLRPQGSASTATVNVLRSGRIVAAEISNAILARLTTSATSRLQNGPEDDPMLVKLLEEALFGSLVSTRMVPTFLIAVTPYRAHVAKTLFEEFRRPAVLTDPPYASALVQALAKLGGARARALLERLVVSPGLPIGVTESAVWALAHAEGASPDAFWLGAVELYQRKWSASSVTSDTSLLRGLVYGMGVARNTRVLSWCRTRPELPDPVRSAARWWLNLPRHILASTART